MSTAPVVHAHRRNSVVLAAVLGLVLVVGLQLAGPSSGAESQRTGASAAAGHTSWNPKVKCKATVATLREVLGSKKNKNGGATYRGGGFKPGIPDKRDFTPPCFQHHVPTFVQLNRVKVGSCTKINEDGDWTCNLTDPSIPRRRTAKMSTIHVETDKKFRLRSQWSKPPGGRLIDIQGFVFWDPNHTKASWHHYSGWEIHSLTAWRRSPKH